MDCKKFRARLHAYLDGELSPAEQEVFDLHVASCPECRSEVERYRALGMLLKGLTTPTVPAGLADRIAAEAAKRGGGKVRHQPARPSAAWLILEGRVMRVAAAVALVVGLTAGSFIGWSSLARSTETGSQTGAATEVMLAFDAFSASPVEPLEAMYLPEHLTRR